MTVQERDIYAYTPNGTPIRKRRSAAVAASTTAAPPVSTHPASDENSDKFYSTRPATSIQRYTQPGVPAQRPRVQAHPDQRIDIQPRQAARAAAVAPEPRRFHIHPLIYVGVGIFLAAGIWFGSSYVVTWWTNMQNDVTYTQAFRTFSTDQVVGHNSDSPTHPSHFIVQNDKKHVVIIEFPADDMTKTIVYPAPYLIGAGQDRTPVTITFIKNPQTHRLDMVLHVEDQTYVFFNNGKKFIPPTVQ